MKMLTEADIRALDRVTCTQAAQFLGIPPNHLRVALEQKRIPIGTCIRGPGGRRSIRINAEALIAYKNGDLNMVMIAELQNRVAELEKIIKKGA